LEHLFDTELSYVLKEAYRVLRPGGFFRVSVPDLDKAIADYLAENPEGDQELEKRAEKFQELSHYYGGHHQVFNFARLRKLLLNSGFLAVKRLPFPQSDFLAEPEVIEIDLHPQESLFVECRKPGGSTAKDSSSR
jgi:predicted SAM-dependent methyltransferase